MYKYKMIMKKILLGLVMLLTTATMNAQIELEQVLEGSYLSPYVDCGRIFYGVDDLFFTENNGENKLYAYNKVDFSLYGVFDRDVDLITRNIFTTDNEICFQNHQYEGTYPELKCKITIFNESNEIIKEFQFDGEVSCYLIKICEEYKLILVGYLPNIDPVTGEMIDISEKTYIYSCPGNGETSTSVENVSAKVKRNAYPNPATDLVTLPYDANGATSMKIYDMQGKLVERKFLDKSKQELQLNVKDYPSGMYFFEVNGESNSFIVE